MPSAMLILDGIAEQLSSQGYGAWNASGVATAIMRASQLVSPPPTTAVIPPLTFTLTPDQLTQLDDAQLVHEAMRRGYAISKIRER
jgi:hypothetical protein